MGGTSAERWRNARSLARRQAGVVSARQLRELGLTEQNRRTLRQRGEVRRHLGALVVRDSQGSQGPGGNPPPRVTATVRSATRPACPVPDADVHPSRPACPVPDADVHPSRPADSASDPAVQQICQVRAAPDAAANQLATAVQDATALLLALGAEALITGPTAAVLHGCTARGAEGDWTATLAHGMRVVYLPNEAHCRTNGITALRRTMDGTRTRRRGIPVVDRVTALLDTLEVVQRHLPKGARPVKLLDLFLQRRWLKREELLERVEARRRTGRRGRRLTATLKWAAQQVQDGTRSEAEREMAKVLRAGGLHPRGLPPRGARGTPAEQGGGPRAQGPAGASAGRPGGGRGRARGWIANHTVHGTAPDGSEWTYCIDFAWPSHKVAMETDGRAFHADAEAFESDRARDAQLAAAGWVVLRFTWNQMKRDPRSVLKTITSTLRTREPIELGKG